jgi:hypothetical protein
MSKKVAQKTSQSKLGKMQTKICKQQTTLKIEKKTKARAIKLVPHFMIPNHLLLWCFLSVQIYVVIHPLSYFFI